MHSIVTHSLLINLVAIEKSLGAVSVGKLSDVHMLLVTSFPNHLSIWTLWPSVALVVLVETLVLTLVVGPAVTALSIAFVVFENALERPLVIVVHDGALAV